MAKIRLVGKASDLYHLFAKGSKDVELTQKLSNYPKGVGFVDRPVSDTDGQVNLNLLDDLFFMGIKALFIQGAKKLKEKKPIDTERALLKAGAEIIDFLVKDPKVPGKKDGEKNESWEFWKSHKEAYERIREYGKKLTDKLQKADRVSLKKESLLKSKQKVAIKRLIPVGSNRVNESHLFFLGATGKVKDSVFENVVTFYKAVRPLLPELLDHKFVEFYKEFPKGNERVFSYLINHSFPFKFLYLGEVDGVRYYGLIPKNFRKKYTVEEIWKKARERAGKQADFLTENLKETYAELLKEVKTYFTERAFLERVKEIAKQGVVESLPEIAIFSQLFQPRSENKTLSVLEKRGYAWRKDNVLKFNFFPNLQVPASPLYKLYDFLMTTKKGDTYRPSFLLYPVLLAGAFYVWHLLKGQGFLFFVADVGDDDSRKENLYEDFYRLFRGTAYYLPPFPFQSETEKTFRIRIEGLKSNDRRVKNRGLYAYNNERVSLAKKTKEVTTSYPVACNETFDGYLVVEEKTTSIVPYSELGETPDLKGLTFEDVTYKHYTVYGFIVEGRGENTKYYLRVKGIGIRPPWGGLNYAGKPLSDGRPVLFLTEVRERENNYGFFKNLFGFKTLKEEQFLSLTKFPLSLIHKGKENVRNAFILYQEDMTSVKTFLRKPLGLTDEGFLIAIFYPLTWAQEKIVDEVGFVTSHGEAFYTKKLPTFWAERMQHLLPLILTTGSWESESQTHTLSKPKNRAELHGKNYSVVRNGRLYTFNADLLVLEGVSRIVRMLKPFMGEEK